MWSRSEMSGIDLYHRQPSEHVHSDVPQEPQLTVSKINTSPPPNLYAHVCTRVRVCVPCIAKKESVLCPGCSPSLISLT